MRSALFWWIAAILFATPALAGDRMAALEQRLAQLEAELALRPLDVSAYGLPDELDFCGVPVDLHDPDVRERVEKEFLLVLGDRAQVVLWIKRARRVFPEIEAQAKAMGTCDDLKYLAVVESGLRPAVKSRASAVGYWQFMSATGKQYGLRVDRAWDERADLGLATKAGLTYLKRLRSRFGAWDLGMAAYNTGPGRLSRAQKAQGVTRYWDVDLPTEAERYVPRILAVKAVMQDLAGYGFSLGVGDGWAARPAGYVKVKLAKGAKISIEALGKGSRVPSRTLYNMNPQLGEATLPAGRTVVLAVPPGTEAAVRGWLKANAGRAVVASASKKASRSKGSAKRKGRRAGSSAGRGGAGKKKGKRSKKTRRAQKKKKKAKPKFYKVRRGDSLWLIAQNNGLTVEALRALNGMSRRAVLRYDQRLRIRR